MRNDKISLLQGHVPAHIQTISWECSFGCSCRRREINNERPAVKIPERVEISKEIMLSQKDIFVNNNKVATKFVCAEIGTI